MSVIDASLYVWGRGSWGWGVDNIVTMFYLTHTPRFNYQDARVDDMMPGCMRRAHSERSWKPENFFQRSVYLNELLKVQLIIHIWPRQNVDETWKVSFRGHYSNMANTFQLRATVKTIRPKY